MEKACISATESEENREDSTKEHRELLARISVKENKLRNLRLLKTHRDRNDFSIAADNIEKWKKALRDALVAIDSEHPEPRPPLAHFVRTLGIDPKIIDFDLENGCFRE